MAQINTIYQSAVEVILKGGTPAVYDGHSEFEWSPEKHHIPQALLLGIKSFDEVVAEREKFKTFTGDTADGYVGVGGTNPWRPKLGLQPLDPSTQQTLGDPNIVALIHQDTDEARELNSKESEARTRAMYENYYERRQKNAEITDLHLRTPWKREVEGGVKSPENRG